MEYRKPAVSDVYLRCLSMPVRLISGLASILTMDNDHAVKLLPQNDQIAELKTIIRDASTSSSDFVFYSDRLIRLVVEEGLNELPYDHSRVLTPTGGQYNGIRFAKGNCGVSICRAGESMEKALRECCRSIRIGKILIDTEPPPRLLYSRLMPDIAGRRVLLLYPIMTTGNTVVQAVMHLLDSQVDQGNIILLNLFCTKNSVEHINQQFPKVTIITSEVTSSIPLYFGTKYFGTD